MWYIDITNSIHNAETMMPDINMCVGGEWCVCVRERGEDGKGYCESHKHVSAMSY